MLKFVYSHFLALFFPKWIDFEGFSEMATYDYIYVVFTILGLMDS